jgi:hypothetical protein
MAPYMVAKRSKKNICIEHFSHTPSVELSNLLTNDAKRFHCMYWYK